MIYCYSELYVKRIKTRQVHRIATKCDVEMIAEGIICKTCKGTDIEIQGQYNAKNVMYRPWT